MDISQIISWIGFGAGLFISIPQILRTIKLKRAHDLSIMTFFLIQISSVCFFIRAVAIKELVFTAFYTFIFLTSTIQIILIWKYRQVPINVSKPSVDDP
jgi:uncharacterized protein with PQ loop repeat